MFTLAIARRQMLQLKNTKANTVDNAKVNNCLIDVSVSNSDCINTVSPTFATCTGGNNFSQDTTAGTLGIGTSSVTPTFNGDGTIEATWYDANLVGVGWNGSDVCSWARAEAGGAGTVTLNGTVILPSLTFAANLGFDSSSITADIGYTLPAIGIDVTATDSEASITSNVSATLPALVVSVNGSDTEPSVTTDVGYTLPALTFSVTTGDSTSMTVAYPLPALVAAVSMTDSTPSITVDMSYTLPALSAAANMSDSDLPVDSDITLVLPPMTTAVNMSMDTGTNTANVTCILPSMDVASNQTITVPAYNTSIAYTLPALVPYVDARDEIPQDEISDIMYTMPSLITVGSISMVKTDFIIKIDTEVKTIDTTLQTYNIIIK